MLQKKNNLILLINNKVKNTYLFCSLNYDSNKYKVLINMAQMQYLIFTLCCCYQECTNLLPMCINIGCSFRNKSSAKISNYLVDVTPSIEFACNFIYYNSLHISQIISLRNIGQTVLNCGLRYSTMLIIVRFNFG